MKRFLLISVTTAALCLTSQISWASKAYVTDSFRISLRRGPSIENKILKFLPSGQPVEILESKEGWSRIQVLEQDQDSSSGWVLSRYLITRLPWKDQAMDLSRGTARLTKELGQVKKKLDQKVQREKQLSTEVKQYTEALNKSRYEYDTLKTEAADYLKLKEAYETVQKDIQQLLKEKEELRSSQTRKWFAIGALVLLCGLIIGLLVGRQEKKRKSYY
ncbi:MAG: TIGR04211 family SH3 domain-containing protein [Deltaproteobacteria bacterium]|nr:TIGR04211 family SH3 domain-containing protein [Deltaproteobacteria bacterium]